MIPTDRPLTYQALSINFISTFCSNFNFLHWRKETAPSNSTEATGDTRFWEVANRNTEKTGLVNCFVLWVTW